MAGFDAPYEIGENLVEVAVKKALADPKIQAILDKADLTLATVQALLADVRDGRLKVEIRVVNDTTGDMPLATRPKE